MACSVQCWWCAAQFQGETQGSLRGRAGAFFPSGSGLEEEAGEGEGEDGEVQAKAREEAPQVQQPEVLSCKYRKLRKSCTSQLSNCKMIAKSCQSAGKHSDPSCPFQCHSCIFSRLMRFQVQGCRFVPYTFSETIRHRWYQAGSKYWCFTRVWLCIYNPEVDPSKTVSSFKIYRIGLGY